MFNLFNAKYRRIRVRHDLLYQPVAGGLPVEIKTGILKIKRLELPKAKLMKEYNSCYQFSQ